MDYKAVIIDGAVPRTPRERMLEVAAYLELIFDPEEHADHKREMLLIRSDLDHFDEFGPDPENIGYEANTAEDQIVNLINVLLPDRFICTVGEPNPGDVIVFEQYELV